MIPNRKSSEPPIDWAQVSDLFERCHGLDDPARIALLEREAPSPEVRAEVESLLAASTKDYLPLEAPLLPEIAKKVEADLGHEEAPFKPFRSGKYLFLKKLGEGGMAEVFHSRLLGPLGFQKQVAIKRVLSAYSGDPEFRKLFEMEARLSSLLSHANIVHVHDFFIADGSYHLCLEYVNGRNLSQITSAIRAARFSLPLQCALYIVGELCKGLDYAHTLKDETTHKPLNIVHRDVTLKNVMVSFSGAVKLVDFGIAKARDRASLTRSGQLRGTVNYMAPEVALGKDADHRSDLFSVGVILYELVSGETLFQSSGLLDALRLIQECELPEKKIEKLDVDPAIKTLLSKALAKDPAQRFQSAAGLYLELHKLIGSLGQILPHQRLSELVTSLFESEIERERAESHRLDAIIQDWPDEDEKNSPQQVPRELNKSLEAETLEAFGASRKRYAVWLSLFLGVAGLGIGVNSRFSFFAPKEVPPAAVKEPVPDSVVEGKCSTTVDSDPQGAKLAINGVGAGVTPATISLNCDEPMTLTVEYPGYDTIQQTVRVMENGSRVLLVLTR